MILRGMSALTGGDSQAFKVEPASEVTTVHIPEVVPEEGDGQCVAIDLADCPFEFAPTCLPLDEGP